MKKVLKIAIALLILGLIVKAEDKLSNRILLFDSESNEIELNKIIANPNVTNLKPTETLNLNSTIREITEINSDTLGGGYPYISNDGLRLYYTKNDSVKKVVNNLYVVTRNDINSPFGNKHLISPFITSGSMGCWLTGNELEIFYKKNDSIFYSSRNSMIEPFYKPRYIRLGDNFKGSFQGISFTPDKQELFLYQKLINRNATILKFKNVDSQTYSYQDTLAIPIGFKPGPGQFSKDGLKYYITLSNITDSTKLYQYSRTTLSENFSNPILLDKSINSQSKSNTQASITADGNTIVWIKNDNGKWQGNKFFTANINNNTNLNLNLFPKISVYPNPTKNKIFIDGLEHISTITILELSGKIVYKKNTSQNQFDISNLRNGIYIIKISTEKYLYFNKITKQ